VLLRKSLWQAFARSPDPDSRAESIVDECDTLEKAAEAVYAATRSLESFREAGRAYINRLMGDPSMSATLRAMAENGSPDKPKKNDTVKQVIVVRNDLGMRKGKVGAQAAHAASAWLLQRVRTLIHKEAWDMWDSLPKKQRGGGLTISNAHQFTFTDEELQWMTEGTTKVCVRVDSEEELYAIKEQAHKAGLNVHLITDAGHTEFHGVPTVTCLAIGPHYASKIDKITGNLSLL
jgi:PTH2 family peptidyl-tRNA hydrolase